MLMLRPHPLSPARPGDLSGHLLAYLSLSPVFVIVGFVTLIIFKRELHTVSEPAPPRPQPLPCSPRPHPRRGLRPLIALPEVWRSWLSQVTHWLGWTLSRAMVFGAGRWPAGTS